MVEDTVAALDMLADYNLKARRWADSYAREIALITHDVATCIAVVCLGMTPFPQSCLCRKIKLSQEISLTDGLCVGLALAHINSQRVHPHLPPPTNDALKRQSVTPRQAKSNNCRSKEQISHSFESLNSNGTVHPDRLSRGARWGATPGVVVPSARAAAKRWTILSWRWEWKARPSSASLETRAWPGFRRLFGMGTAAEQAAEQAAGPCGSFRCCSPRG